MSPLVVASILAGVAAASAFLGLVTYLSAPAERSAADFLAERSIEKRTDPLAALERTALGRRIASDLASAGMRTRASSFLALMLVLLVGGLAVLPGMFGEVGVLLALVAATAPYLVVRRRAGQHLREFKRRLPAVLDLLANGLRAGQSELQAFELVANEMTGAAAAEFRRMHREVQLGSTVEAVTQSLLQRIPDPDLELVVDAVQLAHRVGGDLATMLEQIATTIRQRERLKLEVGALTAQARASVWLVTALVPVGLLAINFLNPDWGRLLFQTGPGRVLLLITAFLVGIGYLTARRAAVVDV